MTSEDENLVELIQTIVKASIQEALADARIPNRLKGTIEDLDEDLDVAYVRMDSETIGSDPTASDNFENPGIIPATRLGETFRGEQVRVDFQGSSGASAMRTGIESRIVLPFGAETGRRIVADGDAGVIEFYNDLGALVGLLTPNRWYVGEDGGALVQLDPFGGLRVRSTNNVLAAELTAQPSLNMRDPETGETRVVLRDDGLHILDPDAETNLEITTGGFGIPDPKYRTTAENPPGTGMDTPAVPTFGTGDDLELRHVVAWDSTQSIAATFTPPTGFTEEFDSVDSSDVRTLHATIASRHNGASDTVETFTNSSGDFDFSIGCTTVIRGGAEGASPSVRAVSESFGGDTTDAQANYTLAKPTGTAEGDLLIAFVSIGNDGGFVPIGWTTPSGWTFAGANLASNAELTNTVATGMWYKRAGISEPADYTITINYDDSAFKREHAVIVAVQDPGAFSTGAGFRFNGKLTPRLIEAIEVDANTDGVEFTNIPAQYDNLQLIGVVSTAGGDSQNTRTLTVRYNNNSGNNYIWHVEGTLGTNSQLQDLQFVGDLWTAAARRTTFQLNVSDYNRVTGRVTSYGQYFMRGNTSSDSIVGTLGGQFTQTETVTSIQVLIGISGVNQIGVGSKFWLYGY